MRNECNIVRDIFPLYVENMVSCDTTSFVEEHLEGCAECREELAKLKKSAEIADMSRPASADYADEAAPLKVVKRRLQRRQILAALLSFAAAAVLIGSAAIVLFLWGIPADSENIRLETEFQYAYDSYLNQVFVLHMRHTAGKPLGVSTEMVYRTDESGNEFLAGYVITVREIPFGNDPATYTIEYGYDQSPPPEEDFDFTITVRFGDTTVIYSMAEEGLFVPQNDVKHYGG